mmetsp:Transcript_4706/g.9737  ORF Transcript_4706/g.9737 Transcript_4706/m.9737 type:complete len:145 (+) Transcript_4706:46-480(+)
MSTEQTFEDFIAELSAIHPPSNTDDFNKLIFEYDTHEDDKLSRKTRVYFVGSNYFAGRKWMNVFVGMHNIRANTLEWAQALLAANTEIGTREMVPQWIGIGDSMEPVLVLQLNWTCMSAGTLHNFVEHTVLDMTDRVQAKVIQP